MILQILEWDTVKEVVTDIWESDNRKELLRFLKCRESDENKTYSVVQPASANDPRKWELVSAIPKGCRKARPCIDGVDFLLWSPDGNHADGTMSKEAVIDAIVEAVKDSNPADMEVTSEGEVIIYTGIIRRPDGSYHEKL